MKTDTLLIVDDDYLTREGLKSAVDWQSAGVTVVGVAENGLQGLEMARSLRPDLIIADVKMPVMDGLEMAESLFKEEADLAILILSGYAEFESARRALDFGVAGFLLKPIENEELLSKVREALDKLHVKRSNAKKLGQVNDNLSLIRQHKLLQYFNGELTGDVLDYLGITLPEKGALFCVSSQNGGEEEYLSRLAQKLEGSVFLQNFEEYGVLVCDGDFTHSLSLANAALNELVKQTDCTVKVTASPIEGNVPAAFNRALKLNGSIVFSSSANVVCEETLRSYKKLVRDAIEIIERDYGKKLSVKSVAYELYTSESHLMHEFKNQTGKTFNECLTDYRMEKARQLLLKGDSRIGEIGYAVGYTDVKYFGQVFKDYMGCTPSEFLEKHK